MVSFDYLSEMIGLVIYIHIFRHVIITDIFWNVKSVQVTMLLSDPPRSQSASTGPEEPRKMKKQPNSGRVDQL